MTKYLSAASLTLCTLMLIVIASNSSAHKGATGIVKERMDMMEDLSRQMKSLKRTLEETRSVPVVSIESASSIIGKHAEAMPEMFPEGSNDGHSEALPAIWQDWDRFVSSATKLAEIANALTENPDNVPNAKQLFKDMAQACKDCHELFRQKKN